MLPDIATTSPFQLTEEQLAVQAAAREFAQELWAGVIERDDHQKFPAEQVKR
ncbi:MAG: acyl-CoA dehydrogenase, partial [Cytophagaceae bacterium]